MTLQEQEALQLKRYRETFNYLTRMPDFQVKSNCIGCMIYPLWSKNWKSNGTPMTWLSFPPPFLTSRRSTVFLSPHKLHYTNAIFKLILHIKYISWHSFMFDCLRWNLRKVLWSSLPMRWSPFFGSKECLFGWTRVHNCFFAVWFPLYGSECKYAFSLCCIIKLIMVCRCCGASFRFCCLWRGKALVTWVGSNIGWSNL